MFFKAAAKWQEAISKLNTICSVNGGDHTIHSIKIKENSRNVPTCIYYFKMKFCIVIYYE